MKKQILSVMSLVVITAMLASCAVSNNGTDTSSSMQSTPSVENTALKEDDTDIINIFNTLSSSEMKGRMAGTSENEQAGQIIQDYFKEIGLSPYNNEYYHEYTAPCFDVYTPQDMSLKLTIDGKTNTLEFAKDYLPYNTVKNIAFDLKVTNDKNVKNPKEYIYMTTDYKEKSELSNVFNAFIVPNDLSSYPLNTNDLGDTIRVSNDIYDKILHNIKSASVDFKCEPNIKEAPLKNIVGKITGQSSERALVISSHYDGAGYLQDKIINSAIDNASGVLTMLKTAKNLSQKYSGVIKPSFDIYFVGFNSEEIGMYGSKAFAEEMAKTYGKNIININYDCLSKEHIIFLGGEDEQETPFFNEIRQELDSNNLKYTDEYYTASDHLQFKNQGSLALTLGEYIMPPEGYIHTLQDTSDRVDTEYCIQIADVMSKYIHRKGGKIFDFITSSTSSIDATGENVYGDPNKLDAEIEKMRKKLNLKFNEYYTFPFSEKKDTIIQIQGHKEFNKLSEFSQVFKDVDVSKIPNVVSKAKLMSITPYTSNIKNGVNYSSAEMVKNGLSSQITVEEKDYNKVMTVDISNIEKVELSYTWEDKKNQNVTHISITALEIASEQVDSYIERQKESITVGSEQYDIYNFNKAEIDTVTGVETYKYTDDMFDAFGLTIGDINVYVDTTKWINETLSGYTKEEMIEFIKSIPVSDLEEIAKLGK